LYQRKGEIARIIFSFFDFFFLKEKEAKRTSDSPWTRRGGKGPAPGNERRIFTAKQYESGLSAKNNAQANGKIRYLEGSGKVMLQRRTDLALEARSLHGGEDIPGVSCTQARVQGYPLTTVRVEDERGAKALGKSVGVYHTLDLTGLERREERAFPRAAQALAGLLTPLIPDKGSVLAVGLGNRAVTPDALGPLAADKVLVTRHLITMVPEHFAGLRSVAVLAAGVLGTTGVESGELVKAVAEKLAPAAVIAIDALAARSLERLCVTVQISDTGISPGSGVGNHRFSISRETLNVPVIAVGVPTVVDGATLCADLLEEAGKAQLEPEALRGAPGASLLVTTRDIDQRVRDMAKIIGYAVSLALQPALSLEELEAMVE